ncbi:uncharacterized protein LOC144478038, partial [Augochlora pura]
MNPVPLLQRLDKDRRHSGQQTSHQRAGDSAKGTSCSLDVEQAIECLNSWKAWIGSEPWLADAARELYERSRKLSFDIRENAGCWSYSEYCERLAYHYYNLACYFNDELLKKHKICLASVRRSLEKCMEKLSDFSRGADSSATKHLRGDAERFLAEANTVYKRQNDLLTKYRCSDVGKYTELCVAFGNIDRVPLQECSLTVRKSLEQRLQNIQLLNVIDTLEHAITMPECKNTLITAQRSNYLGQAYRLAGLVASSDHYSDIYGNLVRKLANPVENGYADNKQQIKDIIVREIGEYNSSLAQVKDYVRESFRKLSSIDEAYIDRKYAECCSTFWTKEVVDAFKELADSKNIGAVREVYDSLDGIESLENVPSRFRQLRCHRLLTDPCKLVSKEDEKTMIDRFKEECLKCMVGCIDSAVEELNFLDALLHFLSTSENHQSIKLELEDFVDGALSFDQLLDRIVALDAATYGASLVALQETARDLQLLENIFLAHKLREVISAYTAPATIRLTKLDGRLVVQVTGRNIVVSEFLFRLENELSANTDVEEVRLVGGDAVHIDADLKNEAWHGKNLVVLTRTIKVHGRVTCDLSGKDSGHSYGEGDAGTDEDGHGKDGEDGYAGESGGNVMILSENIENPEGLTVISNGGKGSRGQDGGNGKDGKNGEGIPNVYFRKAFHTLSTFFIVCWIRGIIKSVLHLIEKGSSTASIVWYNGKYMSLEQVKSLTSSMSPGSIDLFIKAETRDGCKITFSVSSDTVFSGDQTILLYEGSLGEPGGRGGGPGLGGEGGYAGEIIARNQESGQEFDIVGKAKHGEEGENGKGGWPGVPGRNGWDMGYMDFNPLIRITEWPKYFGTDENSKCKLIYYDKIDSDRMWCSYENKAARIVATRMEDSYQRECDERTETRKNSDRRHHARASRKKNVSQDSVLATYSDRLRNTERDTLQSLRSDLASARQQALQGIRDDREQQKKQTTELVVKRHVGFAGRGRNERRAGVAPRAARKEAPDVDGLIAELKREPHSVNNWLELRRVELNRDALDELFPMFDMIERELPGEHDRQNIKGHLTEKYRLAALEDIAEQLRVYQKDIVDDVDLTTESAARYLVEDKRKRDYRPHPVLGTFGQYLYEDNTDQRERILKFCQESSKGDDPGNREALERSLAVFAVQVGKETCPERSGSPSSTVNKLNKQLLEEYRDHVQDEGPFSESYRVLLAYAFDVNLRLYVVDENKELSLQENHNPLSKKVVHVLSLSDGFVQLRVDEDYFRLAISRKMADDLYGRILETADTFERKQEFDDYLAKRAFLSSSGEETLGQSDCDEQQYIIEIAKHFPKEKLQLTRRLEAAVSRYVGEQGILRDIRGCFSAGGCHVSYLELCCLLNSILRCVIDEQGHVNRFRWIVAAHPQTNWLDELVLTQLENCFRRQLPEKPKWRKYLSLIGNKDVLLSFHVKLDSCAPGSSVSAECIDDILCLLSNIPGETVDLEGLELSEWPFALKENYWIRRLSRFTDRWPAELFSTASYHLMTVENAFGAALLEKFLDVLERKKPAPTANNIAGFLANLHNEKWNLSEEELAMLERCSVAEWASRMQQKFVADGKDRDVAQLVKIIKGNVNNSKGITEKLTGIETRVRRISDPSYAIAGGKPVARYTEDDIRDSLKRLSSSNTDKIEANTAMEMLAVIVRAIELRRGFKLRDTQKLTVLALLVNDHTLAQVSTGEGKSLIVVAASIMRALCHRKVDIVTSSSVLAKRDAEENSDIYGMFDVNVSHNCSEDIEERKKAYSGNQVVYGDLTNFQRDYLLDKFYGKNVLGDRNLENVIVDEVDSMLLDKGNNVLYLSHDLPGFDKLESVYIYVWQWINRPAESVDELRRAFDGEAIAAAVLDDLFGVVSCEDIGTLGPDLTKQDRRIIWERLVAAEILNGQGKLLEEKVDRDTLAAIIGREFGNFYPDRLCHLLKETAEAERSIKIPNYLKPFVERHLESWIKSAMTAYFMTPDQDYVVDVDRTGTSQDRDPNITILDKDTGTDQANSQWDEALYQFLQLKHGCKLSLHSLKAVFVSNVSFLKLYRNLYGLTGTLGSPSERALLKEIYRVEFVIIPPARSKQFHEDKAILCADQWEWRDRIRREARKQAGERSVLIVCETVNEAEVLRSVFRAGDAKSVRTYTRDYEKFDVGRDGERLDRGHIIVATNLAGRGTDIKISSALNDAGGLHVCLTYLPKNVRIEQQAFGRAARSGDKGSGQLIVIAEEGQEYSNSKIVGLKKKRNGDELRRISDIKRHYETQITVEEKCFEAFRKQYDRLKKALGDDDDTPGEIREILLQCCLDKWAFWLDENNKRVKDLVTEDNATGFYELLNEFISTLKYLENRRKIWSAWITGNPVQAIKLGKYLCQHKSPDKAVSLFDQAIEQEPEFSEAARYYKALALAKRIDWERNPLNQTDAIALKTLRKELQEAGRLFDERSTAAITAAGVIAKIKKSNNECIVQIDAYEKQQKCLCNLYCVFLQSIDDILGHAVSPRNFVNDTVKEDLAEVLYEDLLRQGTLAKPRIREEHVSDEELKKICSDYGTSAKTLKEFLAGRVWTPIDDEEEFQRALKNRMRLPSRGGFWRSLINEQVLRDEVKYVAVEKSIDTDPLWSDVSAVAERLAKHSLEPESDNGEIFLYAERIPQHKNNANVFKKQDFVNAVGVANYRALKKKGLLSLNRKARVDGGRIESVDFSQCDSIALEDFTEIGIAKDEAERILGELVERGAVEKKGGTEGEVYRLKVCYDGINGVQLPFCPAYENAVRGLLRVRFAYRIALQKIARQLDEKDLPVRVHLISKPHQGLVLELLQRGIIVPSTVRAGDLDDNVNSLYKLPATKQNLMDMLSRSIPIDRQEALFRHLVAKGWILGYNAAGSIREKGVEVVTEIAETVETVAVSLATDLYCVNGSVDERKPLDPSYKDFENAVRRILDRRLVLAKPETRKTVAGTLQSLRSALISLEVPSIKLKSLVEFSGDGAFANIEEMAFFFLNSLDYVLQFEEKRWSLKMLLNTAIVVLMGIGQIIIGAVIEVYAAGVFTHVAAGLISEGVNDLFYAADALTSGYFSWKDYKKQKIESVMITAMTCAVAACFSRGAKVSRYGHKLAGPDYQCGSKVAKMTGTELINTVGSKLLMKQVAKRIMSKTIEGLAFGAANALVDRFVENQLRDFCRRLASTILVNVERKVDGHEISTSLKQAYKTLGPEKAAKLIDKLTENAFAEKSFVDKFLPAAKTIGNTVIQGIAAAAEKRSMTSSPMQLPINAVSKGMAFLTRFLQIADMALATGKFLDRLNKEIKSELQKRGDSSSNRATTVVEQGTEEDCERFKDEVIARWQELLSDKLGRMVEQNIVGPILKAGANRLVSYVGKKIEEMYRSCQEYQNNNYYEKRTRDHRENLENAQQRGHGDTSEIEKQITDSYHQDMLKLLEKTRCPRLFAKLVRENIPMGMVCVRASVVYVTRFLRRQGIDVPGITVVVTGEAGIRQTFSSAPECANAPVIHIQLTDNHFSLAGSAASGTTDRRGRTLNDCFYQALAEAMPQLRTISSDDFRNGAADEIERDPGIQEHIKQGWHALPLRHGVVGGATQRRLKKKFRDCESSSVDNETVVPRKIKKVDVHLNDRLIRAFRLMGTVQKIAEYTNLNRNEIVVAGRSESTDGSSGMGNSVHAAHVLRYTINPRLKAFSQTFDDLDHLLAHTQNVRNYANVFHGVGGKIDVYQGTIPEILSSVNFNGEMTPDAADKIRDVKQGYVNVIKEECRKLREKQNESYEVER